MASQPTPPPNVLPPEIAGVPYDQGLSTIGFYLYNKTLLNPYFSWGYVRGGRLTRSLMDLINLHELHSTGPFGTNGVRIEVIAVVNNGFNGDLKQLG